MEDDGKVSEAHLTSPAAFVEGGIQDACDDNCSICLEGFCESDPSTVTNCKHEFHLQCILEWCQRSSQCPMCWQPISLKDPTSQELFEAVERERSFRFNPTRNAAIFRHPTLGDFELHHMPAGVNESEFEERIIQHLAAAAARGQARHIARREGQRSRSSQGRPQFLLASRHPAHPPPAPVSSSQNQRAGEQAHSVTLSSPSSPPSSPPTAPVSAVPADQLPGSPSPSFQSPNQQPNSGNYRVSPNQSPQNNQDRAGPSEFQTFSESLKSRLNTVSLRYKDSIVKSTRGWKEKLFSRNTTMSDLSSDVRREVNAGIATVSSMMGRLDTRDNGASNASVSSSSEDVAAAESNNSRRRSDTGDGSLSGTTDAQAPFAASSGLI